MALTPTAPLVCLVYRALGLGDLLAAVPALAGIRDLVPGHRVVLATSPGVAPLAAACRMADAVVAVPPAVRHPPCAPLPIAPGVVDLAVNLHGAGEQSARVLRDIRPGVLWRYEHDRSDVHERDRWCNLVAAHGGRCDPDAVAIDLPPGPSAALGAVVVHPGAAAPARRWLPGRFAALCRWARARGETVVVTGSAAEAALTGEVSGLAGLAPGADLAGRLGLVDLARLVRDARLVVSGDTGIAHLAFALGTPSVTLYGPTPPHRWGPPPSPRHAVVWKGGSGDPNACVVDPGMRAIELDEVVAATSRVLARPGAVTPFGPPPPGRIPSATGFRRG